MKLFGNIEIHEGRGRAVVKATWTNMCIPAASLVDVDGDGDVSDGDDDNDDDGQNSTTLTTRPLTYIPTASY